MGPPDWPSDRPDQHQGTATLPTNHYPLQMFPKYSTIKTIKNCLRTLQVYSSWRTQVLLIIAGKQVLQSIPAVMTLTPKLSEDVAAPT